MNQICYSLYQQDTKLQSSLNQTPVYGSGHDLKQSIVEQRQAEKPKLNEKIVIAVSDPQIIKVNLSSYTQYTLCASDQTGSFVVKRRYNDFVLLREALFRRWPGCFLPRLPGKKFNGSTDVKVVNDRIKLLNLFVQRIQKEEFLYYSQEFHKLFLQCKEDDVSKVKIKFLLVNQQLAQIQQLPSSELFGIYHQNFEYIKGVLNACNIFLKQEISIDSLKVIQKFQDEMNETIEQLRMFKVTIKELVQSTNCLNNETSQAIQLIIKLEQLVQVLLPTYENIFLSFYVKDNNEKLMFNNSDNIKTFHVKHQYDSIFTDNSPQELFLDLIRIEISDCKAILECLTCIKIFEDLKISNDQQIKELQVEFQKIQQKKFQVSQFLGIVKPETHKEEVETSLKKCELEAVRNKQMKDILVAKLVYFEIPKFRDMKADTYKKLMSVICDLELLRIEQEQQFWGTVQQISYNKIDI